MPFAFAGCGAGAGFALNPFGRVPCGFVCAGAGAGFGYPADYKAMVISTKPFTFGIVSKRLEIAFYWIYSSFRSILCYKTKTSISSCR